MTRTIQPRSLARLSETGKDLSMDKSEAKENLQLLLSVFDSLNSLCEKLSRLDYLLQKVR